MSALQNLAWIDTCCAELLQWVETQTPSGQWLRIKKRRIGGYLLTRFSSDQRTKLGGETEMDQAQVEAELTT
ncbi:MAG: hypothetical protein ACK4F7_00485 [Inhella sp.]